MMLISSLDTKDAEKEQSVESSRPKEMTESEEGTENQFKQLVSRARDLTAEGHVKEALSLYRLAADIQPSDKLSRKMQRMEVMCSAT